VDTELRIPPHNIEAEQSVLGGLLINPDSWDKIADILSEHDFYRAEHKLIYRHISRMIEQCQQIDVITIAESVERTGKLDKVGGLPYLGTLAQNTPTAANIRSYAQIVRDKRKERDFITALYDLNAVSFGSDDVSQKIENGINVLNALADDKINEPLRLSDATQRAIESLERRYASGKEIHGLKTGFIDIDMKTGGLQKGDLIILAGRPSSGKTALSMNIAEHVAIADGLPVLVFSIEMSDEQLATRAIANQGGVSLNALRSAKMQDDDWNRLTHAVGKMQDAPMFIDSNPSTTATQMHTRARRIHRQYGLGLIVIDYLQLMSESGENRNTELSAITRKLKLMAKDLHVPVICLSQLSRKVDERMDKRPIMSDLRDSGAIEQDADMIIMLYRDEYYNPDSKNKGIAEANIVKQRMGETGTVLLTFSGEFSRFSNFAGQYVRATPKAKSRGFIEGKSQAAGD